MAYDNNTPQATTVMGSKAIRYEDLITHPKRGLAEAVKRWQM